MNLNDKQKTEYWTKRAEQRLINAENLTSDMLVELRKTYTATITQLEKEINAFYGKYATETGLDLTEVRKRLNPKELKDFKTQLKKYYDEVQRIGGYSPDTKAYLRELSAKAYISRLEELQAQMRWQVENLYRTQQLKIFDVLSKGYEDTYLRATFDMQQGIGFAYSFNTLDDNKVRLAVTQKWQGSNFSDRIWADKARLIDTLNTAIPQGVALGQNPRKVAQTIAKSMNTRYSNAERLARTEMNHICNESARIAYNEVPEVLQEYRIVATLDNRTSEICQDQSNKVYKMSEWEEGITAPPFHVNCILPNNIAYSPDIQNLTRSEYSGDVFEFITSKGRKFSVTPNHIMLTDRGWVRAKNIVKGDNIIYYSGWDKFLRTCTNGINPTNNNIIPTIEQCFTSLFKKFSSIFSQMPASPKDFKSDVIKNSKIDIININSLLRNKQNIPFVKFFSDFRLIDTEKVVKSKFPTFSSIAEFLMCIGLASDGIMSSNSISDILLSSSFAHHKFISFRKPSHYNTRLLQTSSNNSFSNIENSAKTFNAFTRIIKSNNSFNIKQFSSIGISNNNIIFSQNSSDWFIRSITTLCNFCNTFSGFISFDDVIDIKISKFSGHVYDISSSSTLYLCNGFLSSNCRTTTVPYFEDVDLSQYTQLATDYSRGGVAYYVPASLTYKEWKASLSTEQEKAFIADKKIREQHNTDKKQLSEYKKLQTYANKNGKSELFEGMPRSLREYQEYKYLQPQKYEILKENARIIRGEMK